MTLGQKPTILIIDDEPAICESLSDILSDEQYTVYTAENAQMGRLQQQAHNPALILLDIWLPDIDGISLLRELKQPEMPASTIIMMSGHGTIETAVEATKLGAYDYLEKPLSTAKLLLTIERALQARALQTQNSLLKEKINPQAQLIGKSRLIQGLREQAKRIASRQVPVLLHGKSGTGKSNLAKYLHQHSANADAPFETLFLSLLEPQDILPTLLGTTKHKGLLEKAHNGTLYIDEIAALPEENFRLISQLIEGSGYFDRETGNTYQVRIIAGTRLPLAILKERLSRELYDQLTITRIALPELAEYSEDVPELLNFFSQYFADHEDMPYRRFTLAAQNALRQHNWLGNIRELKNLVKRLLLQNEQTDIDVKEAQAALTPNKNEASTGLWSQMIPKDLTLREAREVFERQYLLEQFRYCDGNIAQLASKVGMDRTNLYRKLRSLGIDPTQKPE